MPLPPTLRLRLSADSAGVAAMTRLPELTSGRHLLLRFLAILAGPAGATASAISVTFQGRSASVTERSPHDVSRGIPGVPGLEHEVLPAVEQHGPPRWELARADVALQENFRGRAGQREGRCGWLAQPPHEPILAPAPETG